MRHGWPRFHCLKETMRYYINKCMLNILYKRMLLVLINAFIHAPISDTDITSLNGNTKLLICLRGMNRLRIELSSESAIEYSRTSEGDTSLFITKINVNKTNVKGKLAIDVTRTRLIHQFGFRTPTSMSSMTTDRTKISPTKGGVCLSAQTNNKPMTGLFQKKGKKKDGRLYFFV